MSVVTWQRRLLADSALLLVAILWGATFPLTKYVLLWLPPFIYLSVRFVLATLILLPFAARTLARLPRRRALGGLAAGLALGAAYAFQTVGLETAGATVAAFLTGLSVMLVPIFAFVLGRRPTGFEWAGVALGTAGMALLTLIGEGGFGRGEFLVFLCAVCLAVQILVLDRAASRVPPLALGALQNLAVAGLCLLFLPFERLPASIPLPVALAVAGMAITASALAFTVQSWAQRFTVPTRVGLLFAAEPVSAALFAHLWLDEALAPRQWVGAGLILAGILLAELRSRPKRDGAAPG